MADVHFDNELGTVKALGQHLDRSTLHQDPFQNLALKKDHEKMVSIMQERLKKSQEERQRLKENIIEQTEQRIKFVLGPYATEENVKYCSEPYLELIERYSVLVDESRVEIDGLNQVLE